MAPTFQLITGQLASRHDVTRYRSPVAAAIVPPDTTRAHFVHFRAVCLRMGLPTALHADGLALSGHDSTAEGRDPQERVPAGPDRPGRQPSRRAQPTGQGQDRASLGTFQGRVVSLLGHEKVQSFAHAQVVLQGEIDHLNRTVRRTTGTSPNDRWDRALQDGMTAMQPVPSTALLDLHLALQYRRRRNTDNPVDFEGRS